MPIYEYRCSSCGRSVEVVHSIHGTGPETCEVCGGVMRKALTTPAIVFKGSGWAKKDARSSSTTAGAGASAKDGDTPAAGSSDGGKADTGAATGAKDATSTGAAGSSSTGSSGTASDGGSKTTSSGTSRAASAADRSA
jgi:putative FmdB family regulatory protein